MNKRRSPKLLNLVNRSIPLVIVLFTISNYVSSAQAYPQFGRTMPVGNRSSLISNSASINIGVAVDLSGPASTLGWQELNSVQLAVNQINNAGGIDIGGTLYQITLVVADSPCGNDPQAIIAANTLVNAGARAIIGHTCSAVSLAAQPLYYAANMAMISPSATNPKVTQQGFNTTFRVVPHDGTPTSMLATYFRNWLGFSKCAVVSTPETPWGDVIKDVFVDTFTSLGGTITSSRFANSTSDFPIVLSSIMTEDPDGIVYLDSDPNEGGQFSLTSYGLGMTDVEMGWISWWNDESLLDAYAITAGTLAVEGDTAAMQYRRFQDMPGWEDFLTDYQASGFPNEPNDPGTHGAFAHDAANIIFEAIDRADSTNRAAIRNEIAAMSNFEGVVGIYQGFDAHGDVIPQWAWLERYRQGQWLRQFPGQIFLPVLFRPEAP